MKKTESKKTETKKAETKKAETKKAETKKPTAGNKKAILGRSFSCIYPRIQSKL